jgi:hypothetical protein
MYRNYSQARRRPLSLDERRRQYRSEEAALDRRLREERDQREREAWERGERIIAEEAASRAAMTPEEIAAEQDTEAALFAEWDRERQRIVDAEACRRAERYMTSGT